MLYIEKRYHYCTERILGYVINVNHLFHSGRLCLVSLHLMFMINTLIVEPTMITTKFQL